MQQFNKAIALQFWCSLEQLVPSDPTQMTQQSLSTGRIHFSDTDTVLPWLNPEILNNRSGLPRSRRGEPPNYDYQVFLGTFPTQHALSSVQSLFELKDSDFERLTLAIDAASCFASVGIGSDGFFIADSLIFSTIPWAIQQWEEILMTGIQPDLNNWAAQYQKTVAELREHYADWLRVRKETNRKVTVNDLKNLLKRVQRDCWQPGSFLSLACYTVQPANLRCSNSGRNTSNNYFLQSL